jgi:hypothetical protein
MSDTAQEVWLLDTSGSMRGKRIALLSQAVNTYRANSPHVRLIGFSTEVRDLASTEDIGDPHGGTNLHLALERAAELMCGKCVVFTDGKPFDQEACFRAATKVPGVINTVFCGDTDDKEASQFCDKLARDNGGQHVAKDVLKGASLICGEVRELLGLPAPIAL